MRPVDPDKVRFVGPAADPAPVHAVEVSDGRGVAHFVTFWCRGPEAGKGFAARHGLDDRHDRATYHREAGPWLPQTFPGMEKLGWSRHYHLDLAAAPGWDDVRPFVADLPAGMVAELREYFGEEPRGPVVDL